MITCPVCEHPQGQGFECEQCGKDLSGVLGALGPPPIPIAPIDGLEVTVPEKVGEVATGRVEGLEVNAVVAPNAPGGEGPAMPELERTGVPAVGEVPVAPLAEKAEDRAPDDGVRTAAPTGAVTCRYCRHVQADGAICERCGMRLPKLAVAAAVSAGRGSAEPVEARCRSCGVKGHAGARCTDCGRMIPAA